MKISEIQDHAEDLCNRNEWNEKDVNQRFKYLMTEIGELSNELIKLNWKDQNKDDLKRKIGHEIFDVFWNLCDLANLLDIDLEKCSREKMELNNKRKWK
jgi:NTP pyrophosphatase (non-canonical NTP hydrolase)